MDKEKVIKEFELFIKEFHPACTSEGVELDMFREVLALLKQEAVEPKIEPSAKGYWYTCGVCGWWLFEVRDSVHFDDRKKIRYCASCGKEVQWK